MFLDSPVQDQIVDSLRTAYNIGRTVGGADSEEKINTELLERGWNEASDWIAKNDDQWTGHLLKKNNPYSTAKPLPTKKGTVIVPADGHDVILSIPAQDMDQEEHLVLVFDGTTWYGDGTEGVRPENIVPNTWKEYTP